LDLFLEEITNQRHHRDRHNQKKEVVMVNKGPTCGRKYMTLAEADEQRREWLKSLTWSGYDIVETRGRP